MSCCQLGYHLVLRRRDRIGRADHDLKVGDQHRIIPCDYVDRIHDRPVEGALNPQHRAVAAVAPDTKPLASQHLIKAFHELDHQKNKIPQEIINQMTELYRQLRHHISKCTL